jgi:hypothetical protein
MLVEFRADTPSKEYVLLDGPSDEAGHAKALSHYA